MVYARVSEQDRVNLVTSRLPVVEGRVEREDEHAEVPIIRLIAARLVDRSDLLDRLARTGDGGCRGVAHAQDWLCARRPDFRRDQFWGWRRPTRLPMGQCGRRWPRLPAFR